MNTARSASALATRRASLSSPRWRPLAAGATTHLHEWNNSTNVCSKRVPKRTPEEAQRHAVARSKAADERHQTLAKLGPPRPLVHAAAWNTSTNLQSKRVDKHTSDQTARSNAARTAAADIERRQRLAKLAPSSPLVHTAVWNSSTNVNSKAVPRCASATRCDVKQVAHPCDQRATQAAPRPFEPAFPWNASTNVASKRVNLPIRRPVATRGAASTSRESSIAARQPAAQPPTPPAPRSQAKSHETLPLYISPTWSKARVLVRAA